MKRLGFNKQEVLRISYHSKCYDRLVPVFDTEDHQDRIGDILFYPGKIKFCQSMRYHVGATRHMYLFKFKGTRLTLPALSNHMWFVFIILDNTELLSWLKVLWDSAPLGA